MDSTPALSLSEFLSQSLLDQITRDSLASSSGSAFLLCLIRSRELRDLNIDAPEILNAMQTEVLRKPNEYTVENGAAFVALALALVRQDRPLLRLHRLLVTFSKSARSPILCGAAKMLAGSVSEYLEFVE